MFSLSALPQPLAWVCCLIYPWSSALLHTSKSTLAQSTCYYPLSSLLLCQKHTETKTGSGAVTPRKQETTLLFCSGGGEKKSPNRASFWGESNPRGPRWRRASRLLSLCECCWVPIRRPHVFSAVGKEWRLDLLLPSSLDTRVTQWLGWARSLPHSHPLFFALLPPRLSHHYLYCSGWVNVEESSLFDSCDKKVCKLKRSERSSPQMLPAALCTQSVDSNPWNS